MSKHSVRTTDDTIYNVVGVALAITGIALAGAAGMSAEASLGRVVIGCAGLLFGLPFILSGKGGWDGWRNRAAIMFGLVTFFAGCFVETLSLVLS